MDWKDWKVYIGDVENVEDFSIECIECNPDINMDCGGGGNTCEKEGRIGFCDCKEGKTGPFCTEDAPCDGRRGSDLTAWAGSQCAGRGHGWEVGWRPKWAGRRAYRRWGPSA